MDLLNVLNAQSMLVNRSRTEYKKLAQYTKKLEKEVETICTVWKEDAGEKYYVVAALNAIGKEMANICTGYKCFAKNSENLISIISKFEKIVATGVVSVSPYVYNGKSIRRSNKSKVVLNTADLKTCGNNLIKLGNDVINVELNYKSIASRIDDIISNKLRGKITSLTKLNAKLDQQGVKLCKIGNVLVKISEKYELAEKNISNKAIQLQNGKAVTYGDGTPSSVALKEKEGREKRFPSASYYSIYNEKGGLAEQNAKSDEKIIEWIKYRDANHGQYKDAGCVLFTNMKLRKLGIEPKGSGNGNARYQLIKNGNWSGNGYTVDCVDGRNALQTIVEKNGGEPVYNIVVSFEHAYDGDCDGKAQYYNCGHVLMIDKIENGQVYFSDNWWGASQYKSKIPMSLSDFLNFYNKYYGGIVGAAHFVGNS